MYDRLECSLEKLKDAVVIPFCLGSCPVRSVICEEIHQRDSLPFCLFATQKMYFYCRIKLEDARKDPIQGSSGRFRRNLLVDGHVMLFSLTSHVMNVSSHSVYGHLLRSVTGKPVESPGSSENTLFFYLCLKRASKLVPTHSADIESLSQATSVHPWNAGGHSRPSVRMWSWFPQCTHFFCWVWMWLLQDPFTVISNWILSVCISMIISNSS